MYARERELMDARRIRVRNLEEETRGLSKRRIK